MGSEVLRTSSPENAVHPDTRGCEKPGKEKKKGISRHCRDPGTSWEEFQLTQAERKSFFFSAERG